MEEQFDALKQGGATNATRDYDEEHEARKQAGTSETQDTVCKGEVQVGELEATEPDATGSQSQENQRPGVQLDAKPQEKEGEEGELEEGELPESEDEDKPANSPAGLVNVVNDNLLDVRCDSATSLANQCHHSGYRRAEVTLKRMWSKSSDHSDDTADVLPNKRQCLCSGQDDVDEAHERIQNVRIMEVYSLKLVQFDM